MFLSSCYDNADGFMRDISVVFARILCGFSRSCTKQTTNLQLFVSGNIDQVQYCDKIKYIIEFLGAKLSAEELTKIWKMQVGLICGHKSI